MSRVIVLAALSVAGIAPAMAQTGIANGSIRGVVRDATGASVQGASIRAKNQETGYVRESATGAEGRFDLPLLPLGPYDVQVQAQGFARHERRGVTVRLDQASDLDITISVAETQETVTVTADASLLSTSTFDVSGGLNERSMQNMPITSRNSFNLALFAPGFNGRRDDEFGNPSFAFGGMQRRAFLMDGIDNTQRGGPGRLGIFSPETIKEVKVIHNAMAAEYGRTVGGIISMVTKGGSNDYHGAALVLLRRPGLIARNSLQAPPKPFQQWATYSGQVGGPIKKDKLFFFASAEYEPLDSPRPITITPANAQALKLPESELGSAPFGQRFQTYLGRLDYQIDSRNSMYWRYSNFWTPSKFNTSGGTLPRSASNNFEDRNDTVAYQWTSVLGSGTVNEFRMGFLRREFTRPPVSGVVGPVFSISGVATLNSNTSANQYYREAQFDFADAWSHRWGKHDLKAGADIATIGVRSEDRLAHTFTFANLPSYLAGTYNTLTQAFGNNSAEHRTNSYNFYFQDDYRARPNLTLYYGLRYEFLAYPEMPSDAPLPESRNVPNDGNNVAPRFGFNWQPASKTVVRGGYGLFYDTTNLRLLSTAIRQNGSRVRTYTINGATPGAPPYPAGFTTEPGNLSPAKPSVTNFSSDFRSLLAHQANLQVERELGRDVAVTAAVQYYGGRRMPVLLDTNLGVPTRYLADGRPVFSGSTRPDPAFNQIFQLKSVANSTYYGGYLSLAKRFAQGFQLTASYTLGWAFNANDSTGDTGANVTDSTNLRRDYGLSASDQRHRFVFQGVWEPRLAAGTTAARVFNGFLIASNITVTSSFPVTAVQGSDLNGDGVNNDRPLYRGRNDTPGYGLAEVNLRISRAFGLWERLRLEIIGEAENLFNSTNAACSAGGCSGAVITRFDAPDFKRITAAINSRQIQLGGRLTF